MGLGLRGFFRFDHLSVRFCEFRFGQVDFLHSTYRATVTVAVVVIDRDYEVCRPTGQSMDSTKTAIGSDRKVDENIFNSPRLKPTSVFLYFAYKTSRD